MMALNLDEDLKAALRRFRASRPDQSALEASLDAVVLVSDLGGDALLTMDGRLLQDSPFDGLTEIASVAMRRAVLFLGARHVPELARIFPPRSGDAIGCEQCGGGGWFHIKSDFAIACGGCGGMRWIDAELRAELTNKALPTDEPLGRSAPSPVRR